MQLLRIQKITGFRIFRSFSWPCTLDNFSRYNVIYGPNGSGKTTLSSLFRHLQAQQPVAEGNVDYLTDAGTVSGADLSTASLPVVRVFDRETVTRSILDVPDSRFPPIYYFGEDSVEKQRRVEELRTQVQALGSQRAEHESALRDAERNLEGYCADQARSIKNLLTVPGGGPYNNFAAPAFKAAAQRVDSGVTRPEPLSDVLRTTYITVKDSRPMDRIPLAPSEPVDLASLTDRTLATIGTSVVAATLQELQADSEVADWVRRGVHLHTKDHQSETCRFCQQPLTKNRLAAIEGHFNDAYERLQQDLDRLLAKIEEADGRATVVLPLKSALYPHLHDEFEAEVRVSERWSLTVRSACRIMRKALHAKRASPFARVHEGGMDELPGLIASLQPGDIGGIARRHNEWTASFDGEVKAAREALLQDEVLRALDGWKERSDLVVSKRAAIQSAAAESARLLTEVDALEATIRQYRRPADELNQELGAFLGRNELSLEAASTGYRLLRDGRPAHNLSEGERTAIALLYFLKSLAAVDVDLARTVLVIYDPVTSLDSGSLFSAFGMIRQATANAGQLFIFTHNFLLFRQVRGWFHRLPGQRKKNAIKPAQFYMLQAEYKDGKRSAIIAKLDPLLERYESEYHYLFRRVRDEADSPGSASLERYYSMPNIARRLLESFLAFKVPAHPDKLYEQMEAITYDRARKTRVLRFLHTHSHMDQIGEPSHDLSVLSETPTVLKELLDLMQTVDPEHFRAMVECTSDSEE